MENIIRTADSKGKFGEMRAFLILWIGQLISTVGSGMTAFALGVYVYQRTKSATDFALIFLAGMLPRAIFSPIAGVLTDRIDRRKLMIISDLGALIGSGIAFSIAASAQLEIWHVYILTAITSAFSALRLPAYTASAGAMVSKKQHGRVGGMIQLSDAIGQVIAPVAAGALMSSLDLVSILRIDLLTFVVSLFTLFIVTFPALTHEIQTRGSFLADIRYGWEYLTARPGLLGLLIVFVFGNFFVGNAQALLTPMILGFASTKTLGAILSAGGIGMVLGGITLSIWGGGRNRIYTILGFYILLGFGIMSAGLFPSPRIVGAAIFLSFFSLPFIIGTTNAILISKVARDVQGRVFSLRIMLVTLSFTLAFSVAGPLADRFFEPLLSSSGALASSLGMILGTGEGRGIGLMFVFVGIVAMVTAMSGFLSPRLRNVENELPDAE
jgi:MFS family permease